MTNWRRSYNPGPAVTGPVWALARSLATTGAITFVFSSSGELDVSVHRVCFQLGWMMQSLAPGCPIRKSVPHTGICPWTRLIAACHVLLRLREPRHPSCALFSFPFIFKESRLFTRHHLISKQCFLRSSVGCAADGLLRRFELLPLFHF